MFAGDEQTMLTDANTSLQTPPLCPEITLRLIRPDAPIWRASDKHLFADDGLRPYWAFAWGSGQAMARFLLDHPEWVRGRRVLDFGAGSGIAAIAAAKSGAAEVVATELDPPAISAIEMNAAVNRVKITARREDSRSADNRDWDVLLACDISLWPENCDWLDRLARENPLKTILIADPGGRGLITDGLEELACYAVRTVPEIEHYSVKRAYVYRKN
jgi:predicted nicotinamide N-methyase